MVKQRATAPGTLHLGVPKLSELPRGALNADLHTDYSLALTRAHTTSMKIQDAQA